LLAASGALILSTALLSACSGEDDVSSLIAKLESPDTEARLAAAAEVSKLGPAAADAAPALIEALKCERIEVLFASSRIAASRPRFAGALISIGEAAAPKLRAALEHDNGLVRVWSAYALFRIDKDPSRAIPILIDAFGEGVEIANDAAQVLELIGPAAAPAAPALIARLEHRDFTARCNAAHALAKIADGQKPDLLVTALQHESRLTRIGAAYALHEVDDDSLRKALAELSSALGSDSADARKQAVWAVGQMGASAEPVVPDLIAALARLDPDPRAYYFGGTLGRQGSDPSMAIVATGAAAIPALTAALEHESSKARVLAAVALLRLDPTQGEAAGKVLAGARDDRDPAIRALAGMAGMAGSRRRGPSSSSSNTDVATLIRSMLESNSRFGRSSPAGYQLARHGAAAVDPLMEVLRSGDGIAAGKAMRVLSRIGEPALPALANAMKSDDDQLRVFAIRTLAQAGEPAMPALTAALQDTSYPVRRIARYALLSIGTPEALKAVRDSQDNK
jgi:HEAT repeat protein